MMASALITQTAFFFHLIILFVSDENLSEAKHRPLVPTENTI